jgi:hypothetical protein
MGEQLLTFFKKLDELEKTVQWEFLSRWKFERFLDSLAKLVRDYLHNNLEVSMGCSILYKLREKCYRLGGSSHDRLQMDRTASYYDFKRKASRESFTGYSLLHNVGFILDDFRGAVKKAHSTIVHKNKNCELSENITLSYITIPSFIKGVGPDVISDSNKKHFNLGYKEVPELPIGLLRITFAKKCCARKAKKLLDKSLLRKVFELLEKGYNSVMKNKDKDALAIADLQTDLLRYRTNEFAALDELAFHIQTLFGECECSIFLANKRPGRSKNIVFDLYLAATTARSQEKQHVKFRNTFFDKSNSYKCHFNEDGSPISSNLEGFAKTERAFYRPDMPVLVNNNEGSMCFRGKGEIKDTGSFLGIAIPPGDDKRFPYGVIRVVREEGEHFSASDQLLAAAIAKALTYWLNFYPKNEDLKIEWSSEELKDNVLNELFDLDTMHQNKALTKRSLKEFEWLLQKIFYNSNKIILKKLFGGKSGAVVIRVENDSGLDLILKCSKRESGVRDKENEIRLEVSNYREYIEGKLELNHNIIYPELIRETRELVGFATSFLHCRNRSRISITEFCKREGENLNSIEGLLTKVIERIFTGVWSWWYEPAQIGQIRKSNNMSEFVNNEIIEKDRLFNFFKNMDHFNKKVFSKLKDVEGLDKSLSPRGRYPQPIDIWNDFCEYLSRSSDSVEWRETVTHGDIHGDNVFFDPESQEIWLLDFARTQKRVSIFDLAMIESDLKFRQFLNILNDDNHIKKPKFLNRFSKFEKELASQNSYEEIIIPEIDGANAAGVNDGTILEMFSKLIIDIRQLACQKLLRRGPFDDYQVILFLLAFKYMKIKGVSNERIWLPFLSAYNLQKERFSSHKKKSHKKK